MAFKKGNVPWNVGVPRPEELKQRLRIINLGRKHTPEEIEKLKVSHKRLRPADWGAGFKEGNIPWNKTPTVDAYFAGLVDGEGSIQINKNGRNSKDPIKCYSRVMVRISMLDKAPLEEAQKRYKGYFWKGPNGENDVYHWTVQGEDCDKFLRLIKPYLRIKMRQAEICLEFRRIQKSAIRSQSSVSDDEWEYRNLLVTELKSLHLDKGTHEGKHPCV